MAEPIAEQPQPPAHRGKSGEGVGGALRDPVVYMILGPFILLSLLAYLFLHKDYVLTRHLSAATDAFNEEQYAEAIPHYRALLERFPDNRRTHEWRVNLVRSLIGSETPEGYEQALPLLEAIQERSPKADLNREWMVCLYELGRTEEALAYMQKILEADPSDAAARYYRGVEMMNRGEYTAAGDDFYIAATEERWDRRAASQRKKLAQLVFGDGATSATAVGAGGDQAE